jgi:aspartate aminotransferase
MMKDDGELEALREKVRLVTADIVRDVHKRMDLAKQIGEIKGRLGIDVRDEKVEQEVRNNVLALADEIGMNQEFMLRLLNILLEESESLQALKRPQVQRQTHLGIFMKAKQLEAAGRKIIHMEVGEPDYPPPASVGVSLSDSFAQGKYHYTDTRGTTKLREAIAKQAKVRDEQLIVTPGGRFGVFSAIVSLMRAGQEIIVIEPAWPAYRECAEFAGVRTKVLRTRLEDKWEPDISHIEEMITPTTKMIVLNYPNNPTGKILDAKTMDRIVSLAKDNHLYLLSDEVYADYAFGRQFHSVLEYGYDKSIMISSFSKRYAMTGFRVGYAISNKEIISKMTRIQAIGITSVAEPMQFAALAALSKDHMENVKTMKSRLDFIATKLRKLSLDFVAPDGAMYVYPKVPNMDDMTLVERMLEKGVALAPGSGFGESYKQFVRISACQPETELTKGLDVMGSVIKERG